MSKTKYEINMTEGSLLKSMLRFALPLMLSSMFQIFYNAADIIVVSRWTGSQAMASVGSTTALINLIINLFIGMSIGTTVTVSRCYGAKDAEGMSRAVHTAILFSVLVGFGASFFGEILCKPLLVLMDTPSGAVLDGAVLYMRIIFLGTPATVVYNYGAAILRSVGDTKRPLYILAISGAVNFVLNLLFVICFDMGVSGVALATAISKYLSVIMLFVILKENNAAFKFKFKKLRIYKNELIQSLKIGVPAGIQNTFLSLANTLIQSAVNTFGAAAIAGNAAAANIEHFVFAIKSAFKQATVTAISQNYGGKNEKRIFKSIKVAILCMIFGCFALSAIIVLFSKQLLGIYITDSQEAISFGITRLVVTALPYFIGGIMEVLTGYLQGVGYASLATVNSFIGLCGFRIVYVLFVFPIFGTFEMLYLGTPITWVIVTLLNIASICVLRKKAMQRMYESGR